MRSANRGNSCNNRLRRSSAPNRPDCRGEEDRPQTQRALRKRVLHAVARPVRRRPRPPIVPRDTTSKSSPSVSFWDRGRTGIGAVQHPSNNPTSIMQIQLYLPIFVALFFPLLAYYLVLCNSFSIGQLKSNGFFHQEKDLRIKYRKSRKENHSCYYYNFFETMAHSEGLCFFDLYSILRSK